MAFGDKNIEVTINIGNPEIKDSYYKKLLEITFNKKLNFKKNIENLCRMPNQKTNALAGLSSFIDGV